jgi:hypothetical protein
VLRFPLHVVRCTLLILDDVPMRFGSPCMRRPGLAPQCPRPFPPPLQRSRFGRRGHYLPINVRR